MLIADHNMFSKVVLFYVVISNLLQFLPSSSHVPNPNFILPEFEDEDDDDDDENEDSPRLVMNADSTGDPEIKVD